MRHKLRSPKRTRRARNAAWLIATALAAIPACTPAASSSWTFSGNGSWTISSNWLGGVPAAGSDVVVKHSDATSRTIAYDYAGASIQFNSFIVSNAGSGSELFSQSANTFNSVTEIVGNSGTGYWWLSAGTHNITAVGSIGSDGLAFGGASGGDGTGTMNGGVLSVAGTEHVGFGGNGTFVHSGGTNTTSYISIGFGGGTVGNYELSNSASLVVAHEERIGSYGIGVFNQSGGTNSAAILTLGYTTPASGTYTLSGGTAMFGEVDVGGHAGRDPNNFYSAAGTLNLSNSGFLAVSGDEYVGVNSGSVANFNQSGGSHSIHGRLYLGSGGLSAGTYNLSGDGSLSNDAGEYIGFIGGTGVFNQSGGTHNTPGMIVGVAGGAGTYLLSGGQLNDGETYVGNSNAQAVFMQTGGIHTLSNGLVLGVMGGATGTYVLSNSAVLSAVGDEEVGPGGNGVFNHNGGTNSAARLFLGSDAPASTGGIGTYNFSSGTANFGAIYVGGGTGAANGSGVFNLNGGSLAGTLKIWNSGSSVFNFTSGTFNCGALDASSPARLIWTGGNLTITDNSLSFDTIADTQLGSSFSYDSTRTLTVTKSEIVGSAGNGTFSQTSGVHWIGYSSNGSIFGDATHLAPFGRLSLGDQASGFGTYNLSGGSLYTNGEEQIGTNGGGVFNQTGGDNIMGFNAYIGTGGLLYLGFNANSAGTYNLSNSGSLLVSGGEYIGFSGAGTFEQSGGSHRAGALYLAFNSGSTGTLNLSNSASLYVSGTETIGNSGAGTCNQSGGSNQAGGITLSASSGASGNYLLSGGTILSASESIGAAGAGTFVQSGGTNHIAQNLVIGPSGGYVFGGGTLITDGSTQITGTLTINSASGSFDGQLKLSGSEFLLAGGTVNVMSDDVAPARLLLNGAVRASGGAKVSSSGTGALAGIVDLGTVGTFDVAASGAAADFTVSARLINGGVVKDGLGVMVMSNPSNSFAGGITINAGTVKITTGAPYSGDIRAQTSGPVFGTVSVDADDELGTAQNHLFLSGGKLLATGSFVSPRSIVLGDQQSNGDGQIEVNDGKTLTLLAPITGLAGLTKLGNGTLALQATSSYAGPTQIIAGTLSLQPGAALNARSVVTVAAPATLLLGDGFKSVGALFGSGTLNIGNGTFVVGGLGAVTQFTGTIVGGATLVKDGPGAITLGQPNAAVNQFTGGAVVSAGTLVLSGPSNIQGDLDLTGGTLRVAGDDQIRAISTLNIIGGTFQCTGSSALGRGFTFGGAGGIDIASGSSVTTPYISGIGTLHKLGSGTLRVTGLSSFTGPAQVDAGGGTLSLSGVLGLMRGASMIGLALGGELELNNSTALGGNANGNNRISDNAPITCNGGTIAIIGADAIASSELLGPLVLLSSSTTINMVNGSGGTASLSFASLQRQIGATMNITGLNIGTTNRVLFRTAPGSIGAWLKVNGLSAKYDATAGLVPMTFPLPGPSVDLLWGDTNQDGMVNAVDYATTVSDLGMSHASWSEGDFNGDSQVTQEDVNLLLGNNPTLVPEPLTIILLSPIFTRRQRKSAAIA